MKKNYKVERGVKIERSQLSNNDYNPNKTTERQQEAIAESLNTYGQLTGVLVRPDPEQENHYIIIDGEHRGRVLTDSLYVDIVHGLSDADAKKLTVIMNETRGEADKIELAQLLAGINRDLGLEELQLGLPYTDTELEELIALADVDWDSFDLNGNDDESSNDNNDDEFNILTAKVDDDVLDKINQAIALVGDEKKLSKDKAIAFGEVLAVVVTEYLAR